MEASEIKKYLDRIQEIEHEPRTGVYLLFKGETLVYIGVACNIHVRLWQHKISRKYWDSVKFIEEKDYYKAIQIENYFLDNYKTMYNKAGSKMKRHEDIQGKGTPYKKINYPSGWDIN